MRNSRAVLIPFPESSRGYVRPPRVLRRVAQTLPRAAQLRPGYFVRWWLQTLECGHTVTAWLREQRDANRRACQECANAAKVLQFPAVRQHTA